MPVAQILLPDGGPRRIALIKPSALGDIVHSLPVLTALRQRFPEAWIAWIANRSYEPLLRGHPDLNAVIPVDRGAFRRGLAQGTKSYVAFLRTLRAQGFDLVIDLQGLFRSGVMAAATGAPRRVGLSSAREGAWLFYTDVVPVARPETTHAVDRYWSAAEALGAGDGPKCFRVPVAETEKNWAAERLREYPRPWLVAAPGSRWPTKRWRPRHFTDLINQAQRRFGATAVFIGAGDESPISQEAAAGLAGPVCDLTGRTTLPQLAAVAAQADVVVGNDTGPLHLAVALGRPVVAPFTCTRAELTGPYGSLHHAVETRVSCQGSYLKHCPRMICMDELTPDRLWPILQGILLAWENNRRSA